MTNTEHKMKNISTMLVVFMIGLSVTADLFDGNAATFSSSSYFHAEKENMKSLLLIMSLKNTFKREDTLNFFELPYK